MSKTRMRQMALSFAAEDLSKKCSAAASARAAELLKQMLIEAVRSEHPHKERNRERQDSADPS
jgi:hypothetical protein